MMNEKMIWFDMDGTFVDLYGVTDWLPDLIAHRTRPYEVAKPLVNMSWFARTIHELQAVGYEINIVSWCAKNSNIEYDNAVRQAKLDWLQKHLPSVTFNEIHILEYGTKKSSVGQGILFDDELQNRIEWTGKSFDVMDLIKTLRSLL